MNTNTLKTIFKEAMAEYMEAAGREIIREEMKTVVIAMLKQQMKLQQKSKRQVTNESKIIKRKPQKQIKKIKSLSKAESRAIFDKHNGNVFQQIMEDTKMSNEDICNFSGNNNDGQHVIPGSQKTMLERVSSVDSLANVDIDLNSLPANLSMIINKSHNKKVVEIMDKPKIQPV